MDPLYVALGGSFLAAMWFVPVGVIRLVAYRSGGVDHTDGMHNVARTILTIGLISLVVFLIVGVVSLAKG